MKIALISPYLGGTDEEFYNIQSFGLAKALTDKGHEVTVITANLRGHFLNRKKLEKQINGFNIKYLPTLLNVAGQPIMPTLPGEIWKHNFDVMQTVEDFQITTLLTIITCKLKKTPVVVYQGMYDYMRMPFGLVHKAYVKLLGRIVYKNANGFIAKTRAAKAYLMNNGVPPNKIEIIPVGIDPSRFTRTEKGYLREKLGLKDEPIILNIARLVPEKGHDLLINALKLVHDKVPDAKLVIIGNGRCRERLEQLTYKLNLENDVFFLTENIPNNEMKYLYSDVDVNVIPVSYEIFNMTMLESMSCGTPVVASNVGGPADVVVDGENGFLVDVGDVKGFAEKIFYIIRSNKENTINNCIKSVENKFNWNVLENKYANYYNIINKH
jgi:glycosyltransferase involved in cell wall biosynthesis